MWENDWIFLKHSKNRKKYTPSERPNVNRLIGLPIYMQNRWLCEPIRATSIWKNHLSDFKSFNFYWSMTSSAAITSFALVCLQTSFIFLAYSCFNCKSCWYLGCYIYWLPAATYITCPPDAFDACHVAAFHAWSPASPIAWPAAVPTDCPAILIAVPLWIAWMRQSLSMLDSAVVNVATTADNLSFAVVYAACL